MDWASNGPGWDWESVKTHRLETPSQKIKKKTKKQLKVC